MLQQLCLPREPASREFPNLFGECFTTSLDAFVVDLRELDEDSGVARAGQILVQMTKRRAHLHDAQDAKFK